MKKKKKHTTKSVAKSHLADFLSATSIVLRCFYTSICNTKWNVHKYQCYFFFCSRLVVFFLLEKGYLTFIYRCAAEKKQLGIFILIPSSAEHSVFFLLSMLLFIFFFVAKCFFFLLILGIISSQSKERMKAKKRIHCKYNEEHCSHFYRRSSSRSWSLACHNKYFSMRVMKRWKNNCCVFFSFYPSNRFSMLTSFSLSFHFPQRKKNRSFMHF